MKHLLPSAIGLLLLAGSAEAQQWTAEQQEVWEWEEACWASADLEAIMSCFHEDFVGWGTGASVPTTKEDRRPFFAREFETQEMVFLSLKPLNIMIQGNVAVLTYLATTTSRDVRTGKETTSVQRWTDVALRENGRWAWISDHGVTISDD